MSNAKEVERELLRAQGKNGWPHSFTFSWDLAGTYRCMPLKPARRLCLEVASNDDLKKMLRYYHSGVTDQEKWFIDLYKVREVLEGVFGRALDVRSTLKIEKKEWNEFGDILNDRYDLRHVKMDASPVEVPKQEKVKTIQMAREWITKYLRYLGMRPT